MAALQESVCPVNPSMAGREGSRRSPGWSQRGRQKSPTSSPNSPLDFLPKGGGPPSKQVIPRAVRRGAARRAEGKKRRKRGPAAAAFFSLSIPDVSDEVRHGWWGCCKPVVCGLSLKLFSPSPPLLIDFFRKKECPLFASTFPCRPPVGIEKYKKKASLSLQLPLQNHIVVVVPCLVVLPSFPFSLVSVCLVPHTNSTPPSPLSPKNNNPPPPQPTRWFKRSMSRTMMLVPPLAPRLTPP